MLKLTTQQDIQDFTRGCCFFGTGGGGNASFGEKMLQDTIDQGKAITIIRQNDVDGKSWIAGG